MADVIITESGVTAIAQTVEGNIIAQWNDITNIMQSEDTTLIVQEAWDIIIEDSQEIMIVEVQDNVTIVEMEPGVPWADGAPWEPGTTDYNDLDNLPDLSVFLENWDNISELNNDVGYITDDDLPWIPTLQEVTDKGNTTTNDIIVPDEAYWAGWNGSMEVPTKNALYDKIESLPTGIDGALTAARVPFASDSNTLTDKDKFDFDNSDNTLNNFLTWTQRITNWSFTGWSSGWTLASWWAYNTNSVYHSSNGTGTLAQTPIIFNWGYYRVTYTLKNPLTGSFTWTCTPSVWGVTLTARSGIGTYTHYVLAANNSGVTFTPSNTARYGIDDVSVEELSAGSLRTGNVFTNELVIAGNKSNFYPWTTRHISLKNAWTYTWIDTYFWNIAWPVLWFDSSGNIKYQATWSGQHQFKCWSLDSFFVAQTWAAHQIWYIGAVGWLYAGWTSQPTTKLQTSWSAGFSWQYLTAEETLTKNTPMYVITNADESFRCSGTPSNACSSYWTQTDCELRNSHWGCTWTETFVCNGNNSVFNYCEGDNSMGNTCYDQYDEMSCMSAGCYWDSGTNSCSWDNSRSNTCPEQYDESSCTSAWCTPNMSTNTCPDFTDYEACASSGCSPWVSGTCSGTASCSGIATGSCETETGCSLVGGLSITMPNDWLYWETNYYQTFFIRNIWATYNTTLYPNPSSSGQKINNTTSAVLWPWETGHFSFHYISQQCNTWDNDSSACSAKTSCSYTACSWLDEASCLSAWGQCSWDNTDFVCLGGWNCSGTHVVMKDWASYPCTF